MRNIHVLSGLICTGKSAYLKKLMRWHEFRNATTIGLDDVGIRYWGNRAMTTTEKVYRNQLAREEIQRRIIVDNAKTVLVEMVMLTMKNHQEPFMRMIAETEHYLQRIEPERARMEQRPPLHDDGGINVNVVLFYCSLERMRERIERRKSEGSNNSPVFSMDGALHAAIQFEMPEVYDPLLINTTDENVDAELERMREMKAFFLRGEKPSRVTCDARKEEAESYLCELCREAEKAGVTL